MLLGEEHSSALIFANRRYGTRRPISVESALMSVPHPLLTSSILSYGWLGLYANVPTGQGQMRHHLVGNLL